MRNSAKANITEWLDIIASMAMLAAAIFIIWSKWPEDQRIRGQFTPPKASIDFTTGPSLGDPKSRLGMIVFTDFECPFCARFARETIPAIIREDVRLGRVAMSVRHFPLEAIHKTARTLALASECARAAGRFFEMHDLLFARQGNLGPIQRLSSLAVEVGVREGAFQIA